MSEFRRAPIPAWLTKSLTDRTAIRLNPDSDTKEMSDLIAAVQALPKVSR